MLHLEDIMTARTETSAGTAATLTASALLKQMQRALDELASADVVARGPLQVRTSTLALQTVPVKRHKIRRNQTAAYHRRIQKKWTKRYGTRQVPAAYVIENSAIGGHGRTLVAHPAIAAVMAAAAATGAKT